MLQNDFRKNEKITMLLIKKDIKIKLITFQLLVNLQQPLFTFNPFNLVNLFSCLCFKVYMICNFLLKPLYTVLIDLDNELNK